MAKPMDHKAERGASSHDRLLAVLSLFSLEQPSWTVEQAAEALGVSVTTAYRYFASLSRIGLVSPLSRASYALGPAIIEWDRQVQLRDPMLLAARPVMAELAGAAPGAIVLLCRRFRDRVLCVHQLVGEEAQAPVSYERGRPMPLFYGATSRIILAHLPPRELRTLFAANQAEIAAAGLGADWAAFRTGLKALRRAGFCVSRAEVDAGRTGLAAPVFDKDQAILGSLTIVLPQQREDPALVQRLAPLLVAGAQEIARTMQNAAGDVA